MRLRNIPGAQDAILESPYVVQEPQTKKGHWAEVFAKKQSLHIEVGMGKGRFLMDLARLHPEINYVGIEMYDSVLLRAVQKREQLEEDLPNLYFIRMDAKNLTEVFDKSEVDILDYLKYLNLNNLDTITIETKFDPELDDDNSYIRQCKRLRVQLEEHV